MNPAENAQANLHVRLIPDDVGTAQVTGVRFARGLAGPLTGGTP